MLNFTSYICAVSSATTVFGEGTGPVWLTNLRCSYYDRHLDQCDVVPRNINPCQHYEDAAVICQGGLFNFYCIITYSQYANTHVATCMSGVQQYRALMMIL